MSLILSSMLAYSVQHSPCHVRFRDPAAAVSMHCRAALPLCCAMVQVIHHQADILYLTAVSTSPVFVPLAETNTLHTNWKSGSSFHGDDLQSCLHKLINPATPLAICGSLTGADAAFTGLDIDFLRGDDQPVVTGGWCETETAMNWIKGNTRLFDRAYLIQGMCYTRVLDSH